MIIDEITIFKVISSENKEYSSETTKITYDLDDVIGKVLFNISKLNFFNFKL